MTRLTQELQRLYLAALPEGDVADLQPAHLVDAQGRVRAMVLELSRPAEWPPLARVWQAVQGELGLPAPAIAVTGRDGYQLWFSLAQPLPAALARGFLEALRARHLADLPASRISLWPLLEGDSVRHAAPVPARQGEAGPWSAFVAPDLAPMFADEPWLDLPPSPEGQAQGLSMLASIAPADFEQAMAQLRPAAAAPAAVEPSAAPAGGPAAPLGGWTDPRRFLLDVMNDASVPMALRIDAARALLGRPDAS